MRVCVERFVCLLFVLLYVHYEPEYRPSVFCCFHGDFKKMLSVIPCSKIGVCYTFLHILYVGPCFIWVILVYFVCL